TRLFNGAFTHLGSDDPRCRGMVAAIQRDGEGTLWIGSRMGVGRDDGLCRLVDGRFQLLHDVEGWVDDFFTRMMVRRDGSLLVGGSRGMYAIDNGKHIVYTAKDGLSDSYVNGFLEEENGVLWIATN